MTLGLAALLGVGVVGFVPGGSPGAAEPGSSAAASDVPGATASSPTPLSTDGVLSLRGDDRASRADARTPSPVVTPTVTPVPAAPPAPAPIIGTFPPIPGCAATVPAEPPPNGRLGSDQLCSIGGSHRLRADAAATYVAMNAAYAATFGADICITDSYRSFDSQQSLYWEKPGLAAVPGTSNHGWGVAVDVFCGVEDYSSAQHAWLTEHGDDYGWVNPDWAQSGGSRPEPWHWEFDAARFR